MNQADIVAGYIHKPKFWIMEHTGRNAVQIAVFKVDHAKQLDLCLRQRGY